MISSIGMSGGIIIPWRSSASIITPLAVSRLSLHLVISIHFNSWVLIVVYNNYLINKQKSLWNEFVGISLLDLPWLLTGDFNEITSFS